MTFMVPAREVFAQSLDDMTLGSRRDFSIPAMRSNVENE